MTTQIGAEAVLTFSEKTVRKERVRKAYRHEALDEQLRKTRNRKEAKILRACPVLCPKIIDSDAYSITMERIVGKRLRDALTKATCAAYAKKLGVMVRALHDASIIHADLTTSNVMLETATDDLVLIDFGLSSESNRVEDKAVDLHVLKETLQGSHSDLAEVFWDAFSRSYADDAVLSQLTKVEQRGRYKEKY